MKPFRSENERKFLKQYEIVEKWIFLFEFKLPARRAYRPEGTAYAPEGKAKLLTIPIKIHRDRHPYIKYFED
jgi:hypothetical protein